jgi:hypothetical protein
MTYTIVEKDFKEILNCDYYVKEQTEYRPNVGGAILGGLLDGGIGAVMGSMTNMEKLVKCELSLVIMFRDNSTIRIISPNLAGSFMKDDRRKYKKDFKKVSEMLKLVAYQNTLDSYRL